VSKLSFDSLKLPKIDREIFSISSLLEKVKNISLSNLSLSNRTERNLVTYNPFSFKALYKVANKDGKNLFEFIENEKTSKSHRVISFISNSDFVFDTIEISKNIPDSEVQDALYNIIYEELDNSIEYQIMFDEVKHSDEDKREYREFNIFIVDPNMIKYFSSSKGSNVRYVDRIYPIPLLFKSLYLFSGITDRNEIFIYLYRDATSINLFSNGELVYSKGINFSTVLFYERFKEVLGDRNLAYADFKEIITERERFKESLKYKKALTVSIRELFNEIDDVVSYIKRNYNLETIDNIYFSSKIGNILGLSEYSKALVGEHSFDGFLREFSISFEKGIDEIHYLLYLTYTLYDREDIYLDVLKPPPSIFSRPSGQFLLTSTGAVLLALLYPTYNYYSEWSIRTDIEKKSIENRKLQNKQRERENSLNRFVEEKRGIEKKLGELKDRYDDKIELLKLVHNKRDSYIMKGEFLAKITEALNLYGVSIVNVSFVKDKEYYFQFELVSNSDKKITSLLNQLVKEYSIHTDSITLDRSTKLYKSKLKIVEESVEK
jgi:hypothetical protein